MYLKLKLYLQLTLFYEKIIITNNIKFLVRIMDEIDLIIIRRLMENSRLTFRELAEITNMSVSTIHKRIHNLKKDVRKELKKEMI